MCDVSFFSRAHLVEHCHKLTSMGHVTDEILHQLIFISSPSRLSLPTTIQVVCSLVVLYAGAGA